MQERYLVGCHNTNIVCFLKHCVTIHGALDLEILPTDKLNV